MMPGLAAGQGGLRAAFSMGNQFRIEKAMETVYW
jgi:hypothetical protein